jgi:limonene-1,2-epoxide hydrolase
VKAEPVVGGSTDPREVVEAYLDALAAHDYEGARGCLSDGEFAYQSPISSFDSADELMLHTALSAGILQRIERVKVFTDGADVCHFLDMVVQISERQSVRVAHWARVCGGRIVRIEAVFDASIYRTLFEPPS